MIVTNLLNFQKNKKFIDDLSISHYLISYSSTVIEEALSYNKPVIIYSGKKDYKHINYNLNNKNSIYFLNESNIKESLNSIIKNKDIDIDNNINWSEEDLSDNSLHAYLNKQDIHFKV